MASKCKIIVFSLKKIFENGVVFSKQNEQQCTVGVYNTRSSSELQDNNSIKNGIRNGRILLYSYIIYEVT